MGASISVHVGSTVPAFGTYKPDTTNTAVGLSTTSVVSTAQTYSGTNQVFNDVRYDNWVTVNNATNATFNRCRFRGAPAGDTGLGKRVVEVKGASVSNTIFNDCWFEPYDRTIQGYATGGIGGHDWKACRCRFEGGIDHVDIYSFDGSVANAEMYGCLLENLDCFYPATDHADGNHCDNIQITNGSHIILQGNTLTGMLDPVYGNQGTGGGTPYYPQANSAMQFNQSSGSLIVADVLLDRNWFDGGAIAAINITENGQGAIQNLRLTGNRFGRSGRVASQTGAMAHAMLDWAVIMSSAASTYADPTFVATGNVYDDDGTPVVIHH